MSKHIPYSNIEFINIIRGETNWNKKSLQAIRDHIRDYLYSINNCKCYYCKSYIENASSNETIEHIVSKEKFPNFTYKPENLTIACADCNRIKNDVDVFSAGVALSKSSGFDDYTLSSSDYNIIHPYLDEYSDYIEIDDIFYIAKIDPLNKGRNTIEYYNLTRLSLAESKIKQKKKIEKQTSVLKSILENREYNLNEIENVFVSGRLLKYLNKKVNSSSKFTQSCIESIINMSISKMYIFWLFRNLSINYANLTREDILKSELLKVIDINKSISTIWEVLDMLEEINLDIEDRRSMRTFFDIDFAVIHNFFKEYRNRSNLNIQLQILFKFNYVIKMIKIYARTCKIDDILQCIRSDKEILNEIQTEYISKDSLVNVT